MPPARFLQSLGGTCRYCGQRTGLLQRDHPECRQTHQAGFEEMVQIAAQTASAHTFNEAALRQTLKAIAQRSHATDRDVARALEEGWKQGVAHAMSDGIVTREEEERLRAFRDNLALEDSAADPKTLGNLDRASTDRIMMEAGLAAIFTRSGDDHLRELTLALRQSNLGRDETNRLLIRDWEAAVEGTLEDGLLSLDEENALLKHADHFGFTQQDLDGNGAQTSLVQAAVIREVAQGVVPQRQNITGNVPFNLMKSEQLVWVIQGVDYLESVVRRSAAEPPTAAASGWHEGFTTGPAPSGAGPSSGRRPSTPTPGSWASPPSTSTLREAGRSSGCGTTGSSASTPTMTGSASCGMRRAQSPRHSGRETGGSPTTWPPTWPNCRDETGPPGGEPRKQQPPPNTRRA